MLKDVPVTFRTPLARTWPKTAAGQFALISKQVVDDKQKTELIGAKQALNNSAHYITTVVNGIERDTPLGITASSATLEELDQVFRAHGEPAGDIARQIATLFGRAVDDLDRSVRVAPTAHTVLEDLSAADESVEMEDGGIHEIS